MTKTGRPPKPTALKELAGNPGKRPLPTNEPKPRGKMRPMPSDRLSSRAQLTWIRLRAAMEPLGLLTGVDAEAFELLCQHYDLALNALEVVQSDGFSYKNDKGNLSRNPNDLAFLQHSRAFLRYSSEFGMTPSSRARLAPLETGEKDSSLADQLFEGLTETAETKQRKSPLVQVVGPQAAKALTSAGIGSLELAAMAVQEGMDLVSIKGVGPATVKKLEGLK
jgi:P27 family predicted phage terminase small subunit